MDKIRLTADEQAIIGPLLNRAVYIMDQMELTGQLMGHDIPSLQREITRRVLADLTWTAAKTPGTRRTRHGLPDPSLTVGRRGTTPR